MLRKCCFFVKRASRIARTYAGLSAAVLVFAAQYPALGQTGTEQSASAGQIKAVKSASAGFIRGGAAETQPGAKIRRWFEFDGLAVSIRYRFINNTSGSDANQVQYQFAGRGRFKFDSKGRYSVFAGLFSGNSFRGGWNNTGLGTGAPQTNLFLKQLYFDAKPVKSLEFQIGGIGINNGENTEATGYDNDAYITGERIFIRSPKNVFFDEISLTNAYLGDFNRPSVFRRFDNLARSNYYQFLVRKQVNKRIAFSADYTFESGIDTLRQGVKIKTPEIRIADWILFEDYERVSRGGGYGFNIMAEKKFGKRFTLDAGFARIDRQFLNGDRFPKGNRLHVTGVLNLSREFALTAAFTQGLGPVDSRLPRTRLDVVLTYNILETLRSKKLQ